LRQRPPTIKAGLGSAGIVERFNWTIWICAEKPEKSSKIALTLFGKMRHSAF
jgi:hypothetical protein